MRMRFQNKRVDVEWLHTNFPCMMACPAGTNAGRYVSLIAEGRFEEAYRYARDPNPMASVCGRVCAHPCETACRRGQIDKPISIRALKRFLTERYGPESRHPLESRRKPIAKLPYRVAVIGSGPVGLSAAHDLALLGYRVTIFEAASVAGGMLRLGIPEYRLPRGVIDAQIREILEIGDITLELNRAAGRDFTIASLKDAGFDAVVIGVGAHRSRDLTIPGVELDGVHKGIEFLLNVNLGYQFRIGKKVVVIGGGNVAMDVARSAAREVLRAHPTEDEGLIPREENVAMVAAHEMMDVSLAALRMGAREVSIVCLEQREEMPAAVEEVEEAETEGILIHGGRGPKRIVGRDGKVTGLETLRTKSLFDANRRFNPTFYENSESILECDTVIMAIGQMPNLEFLRPEDGVKVSPRGLVAADRETLQTTAEGVFAGGDCVFGPRLIIDSVGDGRRIAASVDAFLTGRKRERTEIEVELLDRHEMLSGYMELSREPIPMLPLGRRTGITEVEVGYDEEMAMREARRCLHCWVNTVFEGNASDGSQCILCGGCVDVCPEQCLRLVPLEQIEFTDNVSSHIQSNEALYRVELDDVAAEQLGQVTGSAMLKDETRCIRCGLCAARCPVEVISMESYNFASQGLAPMVHLDLAVTS